MCVCWGTKPCCCCKWVGDHVHIPKNQGDLKTGERGMLGHQATLLSQVGV